MRRHIAITFILCVLLDISSANAQLPMCPGQWINNAGLLKCRCEDGSFARPTDSTMLCMAEHPGIIFVPEPDVRETPAPLPYPKLGLKLRHAPEGQTGVLITTVDPESEAAAKGIRPGSIITSVHLNPVAEPSDVVANVTRAYHDGRGAVMMKIDDRFVAIPFSDRKGQRLAQRTSPPVLLVEPRPASRPALKAEPAAEPEIQIKAPRPGEFIEASQFPQSFNSWLPILLALMTGALLAPHLARGYRFVVDRRNHDTIGPTGHNLRQANKAEFSAHRKSMGEVMAAWLQWFVRVPWYLCFLASLVLAFLVALFVVADGHWAIFFAIAAFVCWYYRETLSPKKNPGVASGFDPMAPGVTVQDIIRAYHVDPPKEKHPGYFHGSWLIVLGLPVFAAFLTFMSISENIPGLLIVPCALVPIALVYWYFQGGREWIHSLQAPKENAPIAPNRFPTPADTQAAVNQMRLAHSIYSNEFFDPKEERPDLIVMRLAPASTALNKARALDPNAAITVEEQGVRVNYTVDSLSALLLYWEASMYEKAGRQILTQEMPEEFLKLGAGAPAAFKGFNSERDRLTNKYFPAALVAAEKAVLYEPRHLSYLRILAMCYRHNNLSDAANAILQHALKLDPNDLDTLRLMQ